MIKEGIGFWSIRQASRAQCLKEMTEKLRIIVPDISPQESRQSAWSDYWELKRRTLQAFQCNLMLRAIYLLPHKNLTVVDIGDSAGTPMLYLKELAKDKGRLETISVKLDPRAIEKISKKGLRAILCRAEDLDLAGEQVDLFVSFQMVEYLNNLAIFFAA
jgi:cyclopropane fatty-acyl-phospholipid synthase-like methyltransferase